LNPKDLLKAASDLVPETGRPRQANLRRAASTTYYALFHTLAHCCADLLIGGTNSERSKPAWHQVYRSLNHRPTKTACSAPKISEFPNEIQDFANMFVTFQDKRHSADYDPKKKHFKSDVLLDIASAEIAITGFQSASIKDRRAFAAFVLFKPRA